MASYNFSGFENPTRGQAASFGNPNANFQTQVSAQGGNVPNFDYTVAQPLLAPSQGSPHLQHRSSFGPVPATDPNASRRPGSGGVRPGHSSSNASNIPPAFGAGGYGAEAPWDANIPRTPADQGMEGPSGEKLTQRQLLIREIVRTEFSYVHDLGKVIHLYLKPLWQKAVLSEEETNTLFANIEALYALNLKIANDLQAARRPNGGNYDTVSEENLRVGDVFVAHIPSLQIYTDYTDNHDKAVELLSNLSKKNKAFSDLEIQLAESAECKGLYLKDFLIKPVQRICKYPLLFKNLAEMTPESDSERQNVDQCFSLFEDIVSSINQAKDESMNASALAKYDDIIEGYPEKLSSEPRRFIRDGTALKAASKKSDVQYLRRSDAATTTMLLFNDKLLLCTPKGKKLTFVKDVPLWELVVIDTELSHPDHDRAFLVESTSEAKKTWILWWENPIDKKTWFKLLRTHTGKAKLDHAKQEATADLYEVNSDSSEDKKMKRGSSSAKLTPTKDKGELKKVDSKKSLTKPSTFVKGPTSDLKGSPLSKSSSTLPAPSSVPASPSTPSKSHAPPPRVSTYVPGSSGSDLTSSSPSTPTRQASTSVSNPALLGGSTPAQPTPSGNPISPRRANSMYLDPRNPSGTTADGQLSPGRRVLPPPVLMAQPQQPQAASAARGRGFTPTNNIPSHLMTTGGSARTSQPPPPPKEARRTAVESGGLGLPPPPSMQQQAAANQQDFGNNSPAMKRATMAPGMIQPIGGSPNRGSVGSLPPPPSAGATNSGGRSEFEFMRLQNELSVVTGERNQLFGENEQLRSQLVAYQQYNPEELAYQLSVVQQELHAVLNENNSLKQQILKMQSFLNRPGQ